MRRKKKVPKVAREAYKVLLIYISKKIKLRRRELPSALLSPSKMFSAMEG